MTKITWVLKDGSRISADVADGTNLMAAAASANVPGIIGECGGCLSCATCHVYVDEAWTKAVGPAAPMEEDMLDFAFDVRPTSRLSCQIKVKDDLDGLVVTTPEKQG